MARRLLVVDDDSASRRLMQTIFEAEGFEVALAEDGEAVAQLVSEFSPAVIALDFELPGMSGLDVMAKLRAEHPDAKIVMLTAHNDVKLAVKATHLGAYDYLTKPIDVEEVVVVFERAYRAYETEREVEQLRKRLITHDLVTRMGPSRQVANVIEQVAIVAGSDFSVLLLGETGTGKDVVAHAIHRESPRSAKPFVAIDCGAIPENLLESELFGHEKGAFSGAERKKDGQFLLADGGTVFLDEVGNLPMALQPKLLRAIESRQVQPVGAAKPIPIDIRFIAATNADLPSKVAHGEFRSDLYFRLAQFTLALAALRDRRDDIAHLARRFSAEAGVELRKPVIGLTDDAIEALVGHSWPGNVRELRNIVRQAVLRCPGGKIDAAALAGLLGQNRDVPDIPINLGDRSLREIADEAAQTAERAAIREALRATNGNKTHAARMLRTDFKTLHVKMKQLAIVPE